MLEREERKSQVSSFSGNTFYQLPNCYAQKHANLQSEISFFSSTKVDDDYGDDDEDNDFGDCITILIWGCSASKKLQTTLVAGKYSKSQR